MSNDNNPEVEVIEVVNTIETSVLDSHGEKGTNDRERVGVYLGMADLAFLSLVEAGGDPDTVSLAVAPGVRASDGVPVVQVVFRAFRPAQPSTATE